MKLPEDMAEIARVEGLRGSVLQKFLTAHQKKFSLAGFLFTMFPAIRDRALQDPRFMFKLGVEVWGDVALSVASEANSRNESFLDEAEFFVSDVLATVVLNATVLTMLSPAATLGRSPGGGMSLALKSRVGGRLNGFLRALCNRVPTTMPASVFAVAPTGVAPYSLQMRAVSLILQGARVGALSAGVGLAGQGAANFVCGLRRRYAPDGYDAAYADTVSPHAPPLIEPAIEWGAFMGTSGNLRQHLIIGVERALEGSALGTKLLKFASPLGSLAMRVGNNVWGGEQFAKRMRAMEDDVASRYGYYD